MQRPPPPPAGRADSVATGEPPSWDLPLAKDQYEGVVVKLARLFEQAEEPGFRRQLERILMDGNDKGHFSLIVDARVLLQESLELGHLLLRQPKIMLDLLEKACRGHQERIHKQLQKDRQDAGTVKENVHARIQWLPAANRRPNVSSIRAHDMDCFLQFSGTVIRSGALKVIEATRVFHCNNSNCGKPIKVHAAINEVGSIVQKPSGPCPHCKRSASYTEDVAEKIVHDYQEIRVQEQVQKLGMGSIPRSITVVLLHDLVDTCKAGDDVVVTGVPFHRWGPTYKDERCVLETVFMANSIFVVSSSVGLRTFAKDLAEEFASFWALHRNRPYLARDKLVASVCPQLHGLALVKLALLLTLIGSPSSVDPNTGMRVRGEPHLLLVGDPGTGKSQFLRFACKVSQRSVLTTGVGTTSAGLTCSAVREGKEFMLEAGALVLADRGVCCIDEFAQMREHDRGSIHEAMEQQSLSVAKAGLVTRLNTRTTVIAACNAKGYYDADSDLSTNTGIASPLLSRFDLVLILTDYPDLEWDKTVSEFILSHRADQAAVKRARLALRGGSDGRSEDMPLYDIDKLRGYISHVKRTEPELSPEAIEVLHAYYIAQRRSDENSDSGRTTMRLLESLIRLSKAHARLMNKVVVDVFDAVQAVSLADLSVDLAASLQTIHSGFAQDPDAQMRGQVDAVLQRLRLGHLFKNHKGEGGEGGEEHLVDQ